MDGITITEAVAETSKKKPARKRKPRSKTSRKRKPAASNPLPAPVEPNGQQESAQPESGGGLFGFLKSNPQSNPNPLPADFSGASSSGSNANYSEPLSAEAERLLSAIPDVIGETHEGPDLPPGASVEGSPNVGALLGPEVVSAEMLASILKGAFGWVADWRKRDVYRLDEDRAAALAQPWCPVLNSWWERCAPSFLAQFSAANPGLVSAIITTAVIVGPMVGADLKETAKEKARRPMVREGTSHHNPGPAAPAKPATAGGMFHSMGEGA